MAKQKKTAFKPSIGMTLAIWGHQYEFLEHPNAPGMVFGQDGSRGSVYQVREDGRALFGLKVFNRDFRVPRIKETAHRLSGMGTRPGLRAAYRRVVARDQQIVEDYPPLEYAVMMPWIKGRTWYDQLGHAECNSRAIHSASQAASAAQTFLSVLSALEAADIAHTDVSSGNVIITPEGAIELLDLEDIYGPGFPKPHVTGPGTPGYQHRAKRPTWCPEGDRYAAAILAAELLLLQFDAAANVTTTTGFFAEQTCMTDAGRDRFQLAMSLLSGPFPSFSRALEASWLASALAECPPLSALEQMLQSDVVGTVIADPYFSAAPWDTRRAQTATGGITVTSGPIAAHPWGEWVPDAPVSWRRDSDVPVGAATSAEWRATTTPTTPVTTSAEATQESSGPGRVIFAVILAAMIAILLLIMNYGL